jgi:HPt (histidine-containing phosphotransfer) domain-containing protein
VSLDLKRIADLERLMGADVAALLRSLRASMVDAITQIEQALAADELDRATYAAHLCRNDALMVGARDLQRSLADLEAATRAADLDAARRLFARVLELWAPALAELAQLIERSG